MKVNLPLYKDLLEDKRLNLITQINTTKNFINLYKDWRTGSKMQQITRKKSFDRNKEKLINGISRACEKTTFTREAIINFVDGNTNAFVFIDWSAA